MTEGGFPAHKFVTNDAQLRKMVNGDESNEIDSETESTNQVKVLGIPWTTKTDTISVDLNGITKSRSEAPTRRVILSALAKLYDPLGLVTPITLYAKIILQDSWQCKLG